MISLRLFADYWLWAGRRSLYGVFKQCLLQKSSMARNDVFLVIEILIRYWGEECYPGDFSLFAN